jgi:hypothetical protein
MTQQKLSEPLRLLTPAVVGDRLGCSDVHVYRLIAAGLLRAVDIARPGARRSKTRVRSDDLANYIEAQTRITRPASAPSRSRPRGLSGEPGSVADEDADSPPAA